MLAVRTRSLFENHQFYRCILDAKELTEAELSSPFMEPDSEWFTGIALLCLNVGIIDSRQTLTDSQKASAYQWILMNENAFKQTIRTHLNQKSLVVDQVIKALESKLEKSISQYMEGLTEYMIMEEYHI